IVFGRVSVVTRTLTRCAFQGNQISLWLGRGLGSSRTPPKPVLAVPPHLRRPLGLVAPQPVPSTRRASTLLVSQAYPAARFETCAHRFSGRPSSAKRRKRYKHAA